MIDSYKQVDGELYLPKTCWHSKSKGNVPLEMKDVLGIALHKISGAIAFPDDKYNRERIVNEIFKKYRVSYNIWIHPDGTPEWLVPEGYQAFHAGPSRWSGIDYCNKVLIGIGLISDGKEFPVEQVESCADVSKELMATYKFGINEITTHEYIRRSWNKAHPDKRADSRDGDPGNFPWAPFRGRVLPSHDLDGG